MIKKNNGTFGQSLSFYKTTILHFICAAKHYFHKSTKARTSQGKIKSCVTQIFYCPGKYRQRHFLFRNVAHIYRLDRITSYCCLCNDSHSVEKWKKTKNASPRKFSATAKTFCFLHNLDVKIKGIYFVMGMVCTRCSKAHSVITWYNFGK